MQCLVSCHPAVKGHPHSLSKEVMLPLVALLADKKFAALCCRKKGEFVVASAALLGSFVADKLTAMVM